VKNQAIHFAVCLDNSDYPASLEIGKLYRVIPDEEAAAEGYLRVVDESGEDYAFLANRFHPVPLPTGRRIGIVGGFSSVNVTVRVSGRKHKAWGGAHGTPGTRHISSHSAWNPRQLLHVARRMPTNRTEEAPKVDSNSPAAIFGST
jgi:hypothetical protein